MNSHQYLPLLFTIFFYCHFSLAESASSKTRLEEVIVTATKTGPTNQQKTPLSITAIGADALRLSSLQTIKDLPLMAPGISISQNVGYGQLYIRGIGSNSVFAGSDPSSTIHVDGVYLSRPLAVFNEFLDLQQIEVLRGPQGTLYGRNATGGTINLITKKPTQAFSFKGNVDLGSFNKRGVQATVNGAITQKVSANLALSALQRDGYIENIHALGSSDFNDQDRAQARMAVRYQATEHLLIDLSADYFDRDESAPQFRPQVQPASNKPPLSPALTPQKMKDWELNIAFESSGKERSKGTALHVGWRINESSKWVFISSYRENDYSFDTDSDFSEIDALISHFSDIQSQASQEIQYHFRNEYLTLVSGLYWFNEDLQTAAAVDLLFLGIQPAPINTFDIENETRASAFFIDSQYALTSELSLLLGGRYSYEEKDFHITKNSPVTDKTVNDSWSDFSPKLGLQWLYRENIFTYATITKGFKSGGFNVSDGLSFEPEHLLAYEVGSKTDFLQQRLRLNSSVFYYDYTDLQVLTAIGAGAGSIINNAADARLYGFEIELTAQVNNWWQLQSNVSFLSAEYQDYQLTITNNAAGNTLNSAPKGSFSLISDMYQNFNWGNLLYRVEFFWQDTVYFSALNDDVMKQDAYSLVNGSINYYSRDETWLIQLYAKNLANTVYANAGLDFSPTGVNLSINEPRIVGIKASYSFQ
ncbi:MAG: TonB-dependent receptor [Pseudomonadales bacterium]|nr:TonB-dependent receptor [Pseudomonadales bacterium]